jgi:fructokinase
MDRNGLRVGVDLGGTKVEAVVLGAGDEVRALRRVATPRDDYAATVGALAALVREVEREAGGRGSVGVGIPGAISPATGLVKNANSVWLNGRPLARDLGEALGRPVRLANDANCLALSEAADGAAAGAAVAFGAIVGTGCGGGIVVRGRTIEGRNAIAGEWGHTPLPWPGADEWPGPACWCGRRGCIETWLSGTGLAADHRRVTGEELDARAVAEGAARGEGACVATLDRYVSRMARALAVVLDVLDPDVVVLGGGLSRIGRLYRDVPAAWGRFAFSDRVDTALVPPRHGDASGARGAARLW